MDKSLAKRCIVCGKQDFRFIFKNRDRMYKISHSYLLYKCGNCGLVIINPQLSKSELARHYPTTAYYSYKTEITGLSGIISKFRTYLIDHYYNPTIISRMFTTIVKGVPALPKIKPTKSSRLLDIGCGSGKTMALLQKLGWATYGLEIDKNAVKIAKERGLKNVKLGGYDKIAIYPNNYFDCIRLYHVFEHLDNPQKCLELIIKKLKNGGEIIIGTPNTGSMMFKLFGKHWYNLDTPRHLFVFSEQNLKKLIKKSGFSGASVAHSSSDGLGRSIVYTINDWFKFNLDTNKFTALFFILYPIEWVLDMFRRGDIIILSAFKK